MLIEHFGHVRVTSLRQPVIVDRVQSQRQALAPVVRDGAVWTYEPPAPADFFTREQFKRELLRFYLGLRPNRPIGALW